MIEWQEIKKDELIHGIVNGEVVFRIKREEEPPFIWDMTGLLNDRSQYRNDLKSKAEVHIRNNEKIYHHR